MEQKFGNNSIDLQRLREFCEQVGKVATYHKGEQFEREGDPARWLGFVTEGCFKYVQHGTDNKEHITWFSFEDEIVCDYPRPLYGVPAHRTIEAMMPSRVLRVSGEQLNQFFSQSVENMELRIAISEHICDQFTVRYTELHSTTPLERYNQLMERCPGIIELLSLKDIASFLNVTPTYLSKIRKEITFDGKRK